MKIILILWVDVDDVVRVELSFDVDDPPSSCSPAMVIRRPRPSKYLQLVTRTASDILVKTLCPATQSSDFLLFGLFKEYIFKLITSSV